MASRCRDGVLWGKGKHGGGGVLLVETTATRQQAMRVMRAMGGGDGQPTSWAGGKHADACPCCGKQVLERAGRVREGPKRLNTRCRSRCRCRHRSRCREGA